jgi:hypothetical protein
LHRKVATINTNLPLDSPPAAASAILSLQHELSLSLSLSLTHTHTHTLCSLLHQAQLCSSRLLLCSSLNCGHYRKLHTKCCQPELLIGAATFQPLRTHSLTHSLSLPPSLSLSYHSVLTPPNATPLVCSAQLSKLRPVHQIRRGVATEQRSRSKPGRDGGRDGATIPCMRGGAREMARATHSQSCFAEWHPSPSSLGSVLSRTYLDIQV